MFYIIMNGSYFGGSLFSHRDVMNWHMATIIRYADFNVFLYKPQLLFQSHCNMPQKGAQWNQQSPYNVNKEYMLDNAGE